MTTSRPPKKENVEPIRAQEEPENDEPPEPRRNWGETQILDFIRESNRQGTDPGIAFVKGNLPPQREWKPEAAASFCREPRRPRIKMVLQRVLFLKK